MSELKFSIYSFTETFWILKNNLGTGGETF